MARTTNRDDCETLHEEPRPTGADHPSPSGGSNRSAVLPLCELCGVEEAHNFHHLIPRTNHSNKWFKKRFTREEMREGLNLCKTCHRTIHDLIPDEKELGRRFNTRAKLLDHAQMAGYVRWKRTRG